MCPVFCVLSPYRCPSVRLFRPQMYTFKMSHLFCLIFRSTPFAGDSGPAPTTKQPVTFCFLSRPLCCSISIPLYRSRGLKANPEFLKVRAAKFDAIASKQQEKMAAKPKLEITITLPDKTEKKGVSYETTPMDIAKVTRTLCRVQYVVVLYSVPLANECVSSLVHLPLPPPFNDRSG